MKLSAIVITHNEEANIERCLRSLAFADERVVVDAESTDATVSKAKVLGARVFVRPWPGFGQQKNFAAQQAQGEWLLFIDADEEVTPELRSAIQQTVAESQLPVAWLRIITVFLGQPLRHLFGHNPRLFRRGDARWTDTRVHEQVVLTDGTPVRLGDHHSQRVSGELWHRSHPTLASYFATMHTYTTLDAEQMLRTGLHRSGRAVRPSVRLPFVMASRQFNKLFFYRRGYKDGWAGLVWCSVSAYYEWEMARKYMKLS